jgi:hypothetical protein
MPMVKRTGLRAIACAENSSPTRLPLIRGWSKSLGCMRSHFLGRFHFPICKNCKKVARYRVQGRRPDVQATRLGLRRQEVSAAYSIALW